MCAHNLLQTRCTTGRSGRSAAVSQAAIGSRSSFSPGQASLGPVTKVPPGGGARRIRPLPTHTRTARACLWSARAPTTLGLASPRLGSPPTKPSNATTRKHASVVCRGAAWDLHTLPDTRGCQSCRQAPQGRSSSAPIQVRQGSRPRPRSATCGLRSCSRQRGAHPQGAPPCSQFNSLQQSGMISVLKRLGIEHLPT